MLLFVILSFHRIAHFIPGRLTVADLRIFLELNLNLRSKKTTMPGQAKISSFFSQAQPLSAKSDNTRDIAGNKDKDTKSITDEPPKKMLKTSGDPSLKDPKIESTADKMSKLADDEVSKETGSPSSPSPVSDFDKEKKESDEIAEKEESDEIAEKEESDEIAEKEESDEIAEKEESDEIAEKLKLLSSKTNDQIVNVGPSWFKAMEKEFNKNYVIELSKFVSNERKKGPVYPPTDQVFTWTTACDIYKIKVVIIGQDPYHGPKQAHGLCFSVLPGIKAPPSLANMYKELEASVAGFKRPDHGNLIGWATQGVLLLNACLTVRGGAANSHQGKGWEKLTDAAIHWLNSHTEGTVFMLWGAYAQKKGAFINKKKHHVLTSVHPSPLSAHRGFLGCDHFNKCNTLLEADGKTTIDWKRLPRDL